LTSHGEQGEDGSSAEKAAFFNGRWASERFDERLLDCVLYEEWEAKLTGERNGERRLPGARRTSDKDEHTGRMAEPDARRRSDRGRASVAIRFRRGS
jgi:hypothetical protein